MAPEPAPAEAPGPGSPAPAPARVDLPPAEVAARLAEHFPALFGAGLVKPIKLRIQADIQQRLPGLLTRKALSVFLHRHTTSTAYLKALAAAEARFDLDGAPAGEVAAEHREAASAELARRREIVLARRAAERDAQRARATRPARPAQADRGAAGGPGSAADHGPAAAQAGDAPTVPGDTAGAGAAGAADPRAERRGDLRRPSQRGGPRPAARPDERRMDGRGERRADRPSAPRSPGPGQRGAGPQVDRHARPPRPPGPPETREPRREDRTRGPRPERGPGASDLPLPADEGQRARALLLRAWETSPLTKANFCALKRLGEAEFDHQIAQALAERAARR